MTDPITHKARIVAQLQERLAEAQNDEDIDLLANDLSVEGKALEDACASILRRSRTKAAMVEALKTIEDDNRARRKRLEESAKSDREIVAWAMQEAGLPKITAPDMTVSFRMGKPGVIIDREPGPGDVIAGLAKTKITYSWDIDVVRDLLEHGQFSEGRFGNPMPIITVRGR